jgi:hypothetical protein
MSAKIAWLAPHFLRIARILGGPKWFYRFVLTGSKFFQASLSIELHRVLHCGDEFVAIEFDFQRLPFHGSLQVMRLLMQGGFLFGGQVALSAFGVEEKQKDDRAISQVEVDHPSACAFSSSRNFMRILRKPPVPCRPYPDSAEVRFPAPTLLPLHSAMLPVR